MQTDALLTPVQQFNNCVVEIVDQKGGGPRASIGIAPLVGRTFVLFITAMGVPFQNQQSIPVKVLVVADTFCSGWSGVKYINEIFRVQTAGQERLFGKPRYDVLKKIAQVTTEAGVAFISHLPELLARGGMGNDNLSFGKRVSFYTELGADCLFRMYSIRFLVSRDVPFLYHSSSIGSNVFWLRRAVCQQIRAEKERFVAMSGQERSSFIQAFSQANGVEQYLPLLIGRPQSSSSTPSKWTGRVRNLGKALSFFGFIGLPIAFSALANWDFSKQGGTSDFEAGILTALPVVAASLATRCSTYVLSKFFFQKRSLATQLDPNLALLSNLFAFVLSAIAPYGFKQSGYAQDSTASQALVIPYYWYLFTIYSRALGEFSEYSLEQSLLAGEDEEKRAQVLMLRKFERLVDLIENIPLETFPQVFLSFPEAIRSALLSRLSVQESVFDSM